MKQYTLPVWTLVLLSAALMLAGCAQSTSGLGADAPTAEPVLATEQPTEAVPTDSSEVPTPTTGEPTASPTGEIAMTPTVPDGSSDASALDNLVSAMIA